jgi:diaminopropionate ammonia-lyase
MNASCHGKPKNAMRTFVNPAVRRDSAYTGLFTADDYRDVDTFYAERPTLRPSPLRVLPGLAARLAISSVLIKDESQRFGLEAFKTVGVTYAMHRLGRERIARGVVCATAGNHGRAMARAARDADVPCTVFVPAPGALASATELDVRSARVQAMRIDGADVIDVKGTYEDAVARAASRAEETGAVMLSDTASTETDTIARWIMLGYTRLLSESSKAWPAPPHVVFVQGGVGGLVAAAASWFAFHYGSERPALLACEPDSAACLQESARAGEAVDLSDPVRRASSDLDASDGGRASFATIMAGLRCATPSAAAWPAVRDGIDAFLSIPDSAALDAIARLARPVAGDPVIAAGPSGACGVGALLTLARHPESSGLGELGRLDRSTSVMAIVTEGA